MHALETIHTALRPQGLLLDVRPAPRHPIVEIARHAGTDEGKRWTPIGRVDDSYRHQTLAMSDAALLQVIEDGRFKPERAEAFTFIYHFERVETWLAHMAEHWSTAKLADELVAKARQEQARVVGEVRVLRVVNATRLRRV